MRAPATDDGLDPPGQDGIEAIVFRAWTIERRSGRPRRCAPVTSRLCRAEGLAVVELGTVTLLRDDPDAPGATPDRRHAAASASGTNTVDDNAATRVSSSRVAAACGRR